VKDLKGGLQSVDSTIDGKMKQAGKGGGGTP
jgi:hypothetical protein